MEKNKRTMGYTKFIKAKNFKGWGWISISSLTHTKSIGFESFF